MNNSDRYMLSKPIDIGKEFTNFDNTYFIATDVTNYHTSQKTGRLDWKRYLRKYRTAFSCITSPFEEAHSWEFPAQYPSDENMEFKIDFITKRTIRLRMSAKNIPITDSPSLMIEGQIPANNDWKSEENSNSITYTGPYGKLILHKSPFNIEIKKLDDTPITRTYNMADCTSHDNSNPVPFSYIRKIDDFQKYMAATFKIQHDEKFYGCGESFTRLNKRGQRINLWTYNAIGSQTTDMYKPIPFFISSNGYGMFMHKSTPMTFDFGATYDEAATLYVGDDSLDLFIFLGDPKEIVEEYTALTGRGSMPPNWSFGLWMSRITYDSEKQTREVANNLRNYKIPCDVIHLDTGWFEDNWKCNYKFSHSRFDDPVKMIKDLNDMGYHISLWQLPYFTPSNELFKEAIENNYIVKDFDGKLPTEDAIIDFSNPKAVKWYQGLLKGLFDQGVSAIKVDFGEGAPYKAMYHSGKSGKYEHNLYPLRYNKTVADITKESTGENIIWARSAWAGSQRYPLHWGGDAEITDSAMAASLRAGLSLGLCGFTFWSHDIGGFTKRSPEELYGRWAAFGMLTSHSRCHGQPPKEPWEYGKEFTDLFRKAVGLKYSLMPYILEQSRESIKKGYPILRTLFFEYPQDDTAWLIEDQYLFGSDILVAPIMKANTRERRVYLPEGNWVNYFTKENLTGGKWHTITIDTLPIIVMVKEGATINHVPVAQCTRDIDWSKQYPVTY